MVFRCTLMVGRADRLSFFLTIFLRPEHFFTVVLPLMTATVPSLRSAIGAQFNNGSKCLSGVSVEAIVGICLNVTI